MPLPKFLAALQARLPKGKKVAIRIDEKAFGKDRELYRGWNEAQTRGIAQVIRDVAGYR